MERKKQELEIRIATVTDEDCDLIPGLMEVNKGLKTRYYEAGRIGILRLSDGSILKLDPAISDDVELVCEGLAYKSSGREVSEDGRGRIIHSFDAASAHILSFESE